MTALFELLDWKGKSQLFKTKGNKKKWSSGKYQQKEMSVADVFTIPHHSCHIFFP